MTLSGDEFTSDDNTSRIGNKYSSPHGTTLLSEKPRRFGSIYEPPKIGPWGYSECTIIRHGHNKALGCKAWDLFFAPKPGCGGVWVQFADGDTAIQSAVEQCALRLEPPAFEARVHWKIQWRRLSGKPSAGEIEILPSEENVTDQTVEPTAQEFIRGDEPQPAELHWIEDKENQTLYWPRVKKLAAWIGIQGKEQEPWIHSVFGDGITSMKQVDLTLIASVETVFKAACRKRISDALGRPMTKQDFIDAVGYGSIEDARGKGMFSDKDIMGLIDQYIAAGNHEDNAPESAKSEPQTGPSSDAGNIPPEPPVKPVAAKSEPQNGAANGNGQNAIILRFPQITTLAGVPVGDISKRLNKHLPPEAYTAIKYGLMTGKTDVDGDRIRDRFEEVFGPMGIGWRITPHPSAGRVEYRNEPRPKMKDGKQMTDQQTGELLFQTWHIVTLVAHTLSYSVVMPDGSITWTEVSTTTDQHDNSDEQYAYRGALTSLMKQFYKLMGGMNHILYNQYTHVQAQQDLHKRKAS